MADGISSSNPLLDQLSIGRKSNEAANKTDSLGQTDFLKLMIAQMQNQNPMEPDGSGDFLGQMAQFSTVSELQEMQKSLNTLTSSLVSNQALEASSMVGRFVRVPSEANYLPAGEGDRFFGAVDLSRPASNLNFEIVSSSGEIIKSIGKGQQAAGTVNFSWDGKNNEGNMMPEGEYKMRATGIINGETTSLEVMAVAAVESVTLGRNGEQMKLNIAGVGAVTMDAIREIL